MHATTQQCYRIQTDGRTDGQTTYGGSTGACTKCVAR